MKYLLLIPIVLFSFKTDNVNHKKQLKVELKEFKELVNELKRLSKDMDSIQEQTNISIKKVNKLIKGKTELY